MKKILLDGAWQLKMLPNAQVKEEIFTFSQIDGAEAIPASVPGNFELDLFNAGKVKDPYFGKNLWDLYKYENYHLFYSRTFQAENGKNYELCFEGIDTFSDVYVNGKKVLHTDNMLIGHTVEVNLQAENEILVHIYPTMLECRKHEYSMVSWQNTIYGAGALYVRKPAYMFGWDILPRAISGGIFRPCYLLEKQPARIKDVCYFITELNVEEQECLLWFVYNTEIQEDRLYGQYTIEIEGECGDYVFSASQDLWHTSGKIHMVTVKNCQLWWPKNYGKPNLYKTVAVLKKDGKEVDRYEFNVGIRKVELLRSSVMDGEDKKEGNFGFRINGKDIFVLGTNWTPLDIYPSKNAERLPMMLDYLKDLGCNGVRCWGGNLYEDKQFFDFCDENGIIVWQDFALACGLYPSDDEFCSAMRKEAKYIVRKYRNHPSLCLWAGDNECDMFCTWSERNPENIRVTREIFPSVIDEEDFVTPYLPSSPYIDNVAYQTKKDLPESHNWSREWIKSDSYKNAVACYQSEIGYQASPAPESLRKCMSKECLFPWQDSAMFDKYGVEIGNEEQCAHVPCMEQKPSHTTFILPKSDEQMKTLFGRYPENLDEYTKMSQISQAEAFKYFIERMRIGKPQKTGIMWWNLFDGYPVHSNAVIDYYGLKKLAYYYIQRSQESVAMLFDEPKHGKIALHLVNETQGLRRISYKVIEVATGAEITSGERKVNPNGNVVVEYLDEPKDKAMYKVEYVVNGVTKFNHFTCNMPNVPYEWYIECMKKCGLYQFEGFDE
jgi:beta-mannosidase